MIVTESASSRRLSTKTTLDNIDKKINKCKGIAAHDKDKFSIDELRFLSKNSSFDTQPRAYQREKVASKEWKQDLISTVFVNGIYTIPEIHIRANRIKSDGFRSKTHAKRVRLEMIDGQQRWTAIEDYMNNVFETKKDQLNMIIDGEEYEIADKFYRDLPNEVKNKFGKFIIYATMYYNISNDQTADLFVNILNNTNDMNDQEKRNAMRGPLPKGIRELARDFDNTNPNMHKIFKYKIVGDGKKNLEYFNDKFVTGRMQTDEFCAELLYLNTVAEKWTDGVSQSKLTNWYKTAIERGYQNESSKKWIEDYKKLKKTLDDLFNILHETPNKYKKKHSRMICLVMALYYQELLEKYGKIDHHDFVCMFFKVYKKWSSTNAQVYHGTWEWKRVLREFGYDNLLEAAKPSHSYYRYTLGRFMDSDEFNELNKNTRNILKRFKQILSGYQAFPVATSWKSEERDLGPFFNLFGGKNKNALTTIRDILEYERRMGDDEDWGISNNNQSKQVAA